MRLETECEWRTSDAGVRELTASTGGWRQRLSEGVYVLRYTQGKNESGAHVIEVREEASRIAGKCDVGERLTTLTDVGQTWYPGGEREMSGRRAGERR